MYPAWDSSSALSMHTLSSPPPPSHVSFQKASVRVPARKDLTDVKTYEVKVSRIVGAEKEHRVLDKVLAARRELLGE